MADYPKASSAGRSANMRAIRRTDTKPELALRQALHRMGYRFRKDHRIDLDGGRRVRPDIAFTARKVVSGTPVPITAPGRRSTRATGTRSWPATWNGTG